MDDIKILLSALFHDLGKVLQRTNEYNLKDLPPKFQNVKYSHEGLSGFFLNTLVKNEKDITPFLKENITENVIDLVSFHHNPHNEYGIIIQVADWLASSEREEDETQKNFYVPLSSIFKKIDETAEDVYYPLDNLNNIFPVKRDDLSIRVGKDDYKNLMSQFLRYIPKVRDIEQLLTLYEFYFSQVPAQTTNYNPDISIYDHSRITAALAHAIYKDYIFGILSGEELYKLRDVLKSKNGEILNKKLFTLVSGDLSGIQSFLFNVSSESAGKMLKGKSVFLDLLTRYTAKYFLDNTGFTKINSIYVGGGNFDLLLSYIPEDKLSKLREYIVENLWYLVEGDLYLGIEWIYLSVNDLFNFIDKKRELIDKLNERKKKKFSELTRFYELLFIPKNENITDGNYCTICGKKKVFDTESQDRWCATCKSFVDFTGELKGKKYLIEERVSSSKTPETVWDFFEVLGYGISFSQYNFQGKDAKVYTIEDIFIDENFIPHGFLLGSFNIVENNFEKIADKNIKENYGDKKLAYLKMDADNMGSIFKKLADIERNREGLSLTRYGVLSRRIELFFGKYVLELIKNNDKFYPVYIGGDDLFIIGTYDDINNLAKEIQKRYKEYTGHANIFTISAGIYYLPYNFPLIRGAHIVEGALEKAKNFKYPEEEKPTKGKICVEGEVLTYIEFSEALSIADKLTESILNKSEKNKSSRAIISKIENSIKGFNPLLEQSLKGKITPPAIWRFLYYLRDYKKIACELEKIILNNVLERGEKIRNPRLILVATKLAKMKTRRGETQNEGNKSKGK
ncbi:MAG: type III-A CRISPR-associated protein Cas10/Csm1 [Dictyoglomus sp. NZ13-RE01]|nr:MAG: type III-A CRISPR-associated protein Cas10/Csm1 [Dictyoglomus sp. NZ13-RE01]